ncbi:hypothetical protein GIB67_017262 [Kingdonia uniflora]|uniref:NAC domain-containing protein n=1 Tax=Kingdonia uniflora TaxID=39325 RepID=A0A7J7N7C7_9MAGN|nr:hypothetical protein GIB67_017262 [Kingdonia uniflora]
MDGLNKEEMLPPGFRFHPTDEELITYYLAQKISDASFTCRAIGDVDLNKCEPWDLPGKRKGEKEWYFFSLRTSESSKGGENKLGHARISQYSKTTFRLLRTNGWSAGLPEESMGGKKYPSTNIEQIHTTSKLVQA